MVNLTKQYGITKKKLNDLIRKEIKEAGYGSSQYIKDGAYKPVPDPSTWGGFFHGDPYESSHGSYTEEAPYLEIYIYERDYSDHSFHGAGDLVDVVTVGDILYRFGKIEESRATA